MLNHDVDALTKQLEGLRVERLKEIKEVETDTCIELAAEKAEALKRR